jgi:hypothetical protein
MIQANELRIGSIVKRLGKLTHITAIQQSENVTYVTTPLSGAITINQIDPIPLTPEILEKCGFKKKINKSDKPYFIQNINDRNYIIYSYQIKRWQVFHEINGNDSFLCVLDSLHHLQNLIFVLTGKELEIKDLK